MWSAYVCNRYCLVMFGHWIIFYLFGSDVSDCLPSRAISKLSRRGQPREDLESWQKIMKAYQISPHPGFVRSMLDICILYVITSYHINLWSIYILFIDCIIYQNIPEIQIQHWCCFTILCTSQGTLAAQGQSSLILRDFLKASQPTILASTICSPATPTGEECEKKNSDVAIKVHETTNILLVFYVLSDESGHLLSTGLDVRKCRLWWGSSFRILQPASRNSGASHIRQKPEPRLSDQPPCHSTSLKSQDLGAVGSTSVGFGLIGVFLVPI